MVCKVRFLQSGTISVYTRPFLLQMPKTRVLPEAPRPRLPRTRRAPKSDSSASTSHAEKGEARACGGDARSDFEKDPGDTLACQSGECGRLSGRQIERETAHDCPECTLANLGTPIVTV